MEAFILFCLGAILASFVSVIAERAYTGQSWSKGRSRCDSCATDLTSHDLVPILSWILARGRCRSCGSKVPVQYVVVEAVMGTIFVLGYLKLGIALSLLWFALSMLVLLFIVLYDTRHTIVPVPASILLLVFSGLYAVTVSLDLYSLGVWSMTAAITGLFFFSLYFFSKGRAMGLGDTPVAIALALLTGYSAFSGFLFTFWIGGVIGIVILVLRRGGPRLGIEVPFVPFLAAGYLLAFFTQWNPFIF
ncbi:prepilin peptidase [Patescibacteria group bacterium]|nr:prepilin peptidase [Patescibacteria group bacterium]MBU0801450.1 prepilin peptidase [Alphaproteobacteria bacterium]MBU1754899.1 prepilin peptidase [Patescibacteria group bacterium]